MGTQKLSAGIKSKIIGWELIGGKYDGEDFKQLIFRQKYYGQ